MIPVGADPSVEVPVIAREDLTEHSIELNMTKARILELESVETISVCRLKELLEKVKLSHAEEVSNLSRTSAENVNSLIDNV